MGVFLLSNIFCHVVYIASCFFVLLIYNESHLKFEVVQNEV